MKKVLLKDIAEIAGVSVSQASRALNQKTNVAPQLRTRIVELAKSMNYRNSSVKHVQTFAAVFNGNSNFNTSLVNELIIEAKRRHFRLLMIPTNSIDVVNDQRFDGVIAVNGRKIIPVLSKSCNLPIITINSYGMFWDHISSVLPDADNESKTVIDHFVSQGHSKIARIRKRYAGMTDREWERGLDSFYRTADEYGIRKSVCFRSYSTKKKLKQVIEGLLNEGFTALWAITDNAPGMIDVIHSLNQRIPDDISLITYEATLLSRHLNPPMTTVSIDFSALAKAAIRQIEKEIIHGTGPCQIIVPSKLIVRKSTQCLCQH